MERFWFIIGLLLLTLLVVLGTLGPSLYHKQYEIQKTTVIVREGSTQEINLSDLRSQQEDLFTVYFVPGYEGLAAEIVHSLRDIWTAILQRLGLYLGPFAIAIIPPLAEGQGGVQIDGAVFPLLLTQSGSSLQETGALRDFYHFVPHEATEQVVAFKLYHDRAARWVGDGLAEYAAYISSPTDVLRSRLLEIRYKDVLRFMQKRDWKSYDLTKYFLVRGAHKGPMELEEITSYTGYAISLAFWLQIVQKHGEGTIKKFWERVSQISHPTAKDAARILSELTGEDIWSKLQNMDLQEVLQTLEAAAGA